MPQPFNNAPLRNWSGTFCVLLLLLAAPVAAQRVPTRPYWRTESGFLALHQAVRDTHSDVQALLIASHPDDPYVAPAAYLRFRLGYRVAVVLFTRGKGGQNSQGPETGDQLGRLRTLEAEAGAAHFGVQVYYLNRPDGGFSRTGEEALEQWDRVSTSQELARLIRTIAPDMLLTTHHEEEPHGHDQALLRITRSAVKLAADKKFASNGLPPFRVSRYFRGATSKEQPDLRINMVDLDEPRGRTYQQLAYGALLEHASQRPLLPMETLLPQVLRLVSVPLDGVPRRTDLQTGLPDFWQMLRGQGLDAAMVNELQQTLSGLRVSPERSSTFLTKALSAYRTLSGLKTLDAETTRRRDRRLTALRDVVLRALSLDVDVMIDAQREVVVGDELPIGLRLHSNGKVAAKLVAVEALNGGKLQLDSPMPLILQGGDPQVFAATYRPAPLSEQDLHQLFVRSRFRPPLRIRFVVRVADVDLAFERSIRRNLLPPLELEVSPQPLLLASEATSVRFVVSIKRNTSRKIERRLLVRAPAGMSVRDGVRKVVMQQERFTEFAFQLNAPAYMAPGVHFLQVRLGSGSEQRKLKVRVHKVDVSVRPGLRVALIRGRDDTAKQVLQSLIGGRDLTVFGSNEPLPILDRRNFDTVVVDIRAMRSKSLRPAAARLIDFVRNGGRLVVFYHKDSEFNLEAAGFRGAPYRLSIGKGRVTREDAPIRVLEPGHLLLRRPNKITAQAWDGWTQERGLYFPKDYDPRFQELLALSDPGQPEEKGALLYARYGKGEYIYCALALYRQLKNLHPGACRLFANLISPAKSE